MNDRGSIFLETIVAAAIVAMILGVTLEAISNSAARTARISAASGALMIAESHLAEIGAATPLVPGTAQGTEGGFRWRLDVRPQGTRGPAGTPYLVTIEVAAPQGRFATRLQTVRLG